jgi:hypothetical protein
MNIAWNYYTANWNACSECDVFAEMQTVSLSLWVVCGCFLGAGCAAFSFDFDAPAPTPDPGLQKGKCVVRPNVRETCDMCGLLVSDISTEQCCTRRSRFEQCRLAVVSAWTPYGETIARYNQSSGNFIVISGCLVN